MSQPSSPKPRASSKAAHRAAAAAQQARALPPGDGDPDDPVDPIDPFGPPGPPRPDSIINAGDCRVAVNVHVYEHDCDGRLVALRPGDPRVRVLVEVDVHLHCRRPPR